MKKSIYMVIFVFCFILFKIGTIHALLKVDIGGSCTKITETISGYVTAAKKKIDESVAVQTAIIYGKGSIETLKQLQEIKSGAEEKIKTIKEDPMGAGVDVLSDTIEQTGLKETEIYQNVEEKIASKTEDFEFLNNLQEKKEELEKGIEQKITAAKEKVQAKIDVLKKNNENLEKLSEQDPSKKAENAAQITKNEAEIKALETSLETDINNINAENLASLTDYTEQIDILKNKANDLANQAKEKATQQLMDKFNSMDNKAVLADTIDKNFIDDNEIENSENITKIKTYRTYMATQDSLDSISKSVMIKQGLDEANIETEKIANRTNTLDGSTAAINMNTQVVIQNIKSLEKYIEIMLIDLKVKTSIAFAESNIYKQPDASSDIGNFNLDNYIYETDNLDGESK